MPLYKDSVYLDGIKAQELERRASMSALAESDIEDNLNCELTDLMADLYASNEYRIKKHCTRMA